MFDIFNKNKVKILESKITDLERKIMLENAKVAYWKCKFNFPDKEPNIVGTKEAIEYIKGQN